MYRAASVLYILHVYDFRKRADGEHTDSGSGPRQHLHVREIIRQVEAVPTFRVTRHYTDQETARHATQAKEIYGYLVIPNQFEADATAGRDATLSYYYHYALLSVGGEGTWGLRDPAAYAFPRPGGCASYGDGAGGESDNHLPITGTIQ